MEDSGNEEFKGFAASPSDTTHRSVPRALLHRDTGFRRRHNGIPIEFQWAAEDKLVLKDYEEMKCQLPGVPTRSTFLMVFSPDGKRVASTHGNHNIYVTDLTSGKNINTLTGHPRTPWCIAFHPSSNQILASGCLGGQVRVWDLHGGSEMWITKSQTVIASIAFHPTERMLVIATYNELYFWDWSQPEPYAKCNTSNEKEKVRYVSFDPLGYKLITGISNAPPLVSQWDRGAPPTSTGNQGTTSTINSPSTSAGLPHDPDQRRITICYRSLVEQYEQLVQRYYDLTRSRATPTMDRGTDPMDTDNSSVPPSNLSTSDETARLRHTSRNMAMRCRQIGLGSCRQMFGSPDLRPSNSGTNPLGDPGASTSTASVPSSSDRSNSSQQQIGRAGNDVVRGPSATPETQPESEQARVPRWLHTHRFSDAGASRSSPVEVAAEAASSVSASRRISSLHTEVGSYMEQNRNRRSLSREPSSMTRRNFLRLLREHHRILPRHASPSASPTQQDVQVADTDSAEPRMERRNQSHIRTYEVNQTGPILPSFSSTPESSVDAPSSSTAVESSSPVFPSFFSRDSDRTRLPTPERPRRFFFSQRSAFQPQAPRSSTTPESYTYMEERSRRLDNLTRLFNRRNISIRPQPPRPPPPPPPPPPHDPRSDSTADIGVRYGIQLLSRHIDNMQRLCRARLEILQLQQIRRMWEDLQLQIRSLHAASRSAASGSVSIPPNEPSPLTATATAASTPELPLLHPDEILPPTPFVGNASTGAYNPSVTPASRARQELYRYLSCRSQQPPRVTRASRRSADQRRSNVAWRHYSGRRPGQGQERASYRYQPCVVTTTESSAQASIGGEGIRERETPVVDLTTTDEETPVVELDDAEPTIQASTMPADEVIAPSTSNGSGASGSHVTIDSRRGVKRSHSEMEAQTSPAESSGTSESQPTAGQGRTTSQSLRSMIARLEALVRQQREQREVLQNASSAGDQLADPPPTVYRGRTANLSAEERLATALQNEEYESGRLYRSSLERNSRNEAWEYTRESTRLRARQVLSLMVESLTQFFEENGLSHNTPDAVLDDQIYNLFILLQLALELTDLLLAQLASTRRELEHQWVHRLRSPVALEASGPTFRQDRSAPPPPPPPPPSGRPTTRRGRATASCVRPPSIRRPLFHPRGPRESDTTSARTSGTLVDPMSTELRRVWDSCFPPSVRRPFSHPRGARESDTGSARTSGNLPIAESSEAMRRSDLHRCTIAARLRAAAQTPAADGDPTRGERRPFVPRRTLRMSTGSRVTTLDYDRFRSESIRLQTPEDRRRDEREFMVQVRRYQNQQSQAAPESAAGESPRTTTTSDSFTVPVVRVNDVLVVDTATLSQPRPGPPSPPNPRAAHAAGLWGTFAESEAEPVPWRPQRFLHPRYRFEAPPQDTPYEIAGGGEGFNILRVMGPAFATEHVVLADSPVMPNHRIQAWDFTHLYIPDITDVEKNVVAAECKIHNDASVDVSSDGKLLVTLLPSGRLSMTTMLGIYSLQWKTLGQCLYTTRFDQNAVSVSLSPVSRHLLVGLASRRVGAAMSDLHTMAQIFRLDKGHPVVAGSPRGRLCHLRDIEQSREQPFMSINCIRWAPVAGQGLVYGTNNGQLKVLR